jgi:hypothetical protein
MGRREAWDKEYESHFHWFLENESKKEENRRRAAWDEDYCHLLKPTVGKQSSTTQHRQKNKPCKRARALSSWFSQSLGFSSCVLASWKKDTLTITRIQRSESRNTDMQANSFEGYYDGKKFVF